MQRHRIVGMIGVLAAVGLLIPSGASGDQQILDDLIVDGSLCVGQDCVNGESFGFDTIRIKENNLRIRAVDTSSTASFPSNDWQITFNDSSNGGANKFSIDDIDGGKTPFTIEANAPSNSLYVDNAGRIGLGTNNPVVEVHIVDGDTPTLRLEQDGSSGFTPQTWDLAGNETNFFIRDATNGSTLPFRVFPGAPSNALTIAANGNVGVGLQTAGERFTVKSAADNSDVFRIDNHDNNDPLLDFTDAGDEGILDLFEAGANTIRLRAGGTSFLTGGRLGIGLSDPSELLEVGTLGSGLNARCDGTTWIDVSSRTVKDNIDQLDSEEALKALRALVPVKFNYKQTPEESSVGFIAEDVPELVARNDRRSLVAMDIVGVVTKVAQEQQKTIESQQETIEELQRRLEQLEKQMKVAK